MRNRIGLFVLALALMSGCAALRASEKVQPCATPAPVAEKAEESAQVKAKTGAAEAKEAHYCGALTKAGTACRHRVKKEGEHCWMHGGAKATEK